VPVGEAVGVALGEVVDVIVPVELVLLVPVGEGDEVDVGVPVRVELGVQVAVGEAVSVGVPGQDTILILFPAQSAATIMDPPAFTATLRIPVYVNMAIPPGPSAYPLVPLPATSDCVPALVTLMILLFHEDATYVVL
jgi:hypothetical protein